MFHQIKVFKAVFDKMYKFIDRTRGYSSLPDKEFALSTPEFMKSKQHKAFSTVFKDVTNELTSIERLGGLRDKLASNFTIDDSYYTEPKQRIRDSVT